MRFIIIKKKPATRSHRFLLRYNYRSDIANFIMKKDSFARGGLNFLADFGNFANFWHPWHFWQFFSCLRLFVPVRKGGSMSKKSNNNKNNLKVFSVWVAIILCFFLGIIITIGGCLWCISRISHVFKISYSGYAMALLCLLILAELWAIFSVCSLI